MDSTIKSDVQEVTTGERATTYPQGVRVHLSNHTPSWKVFDRGYAYVEFGMGVGSDFLSIVAEEGVANAGERVSSKTVMLTIRGEALDALRDLLGPKVQS